MSPRWATVAGYGLYFYAAERHRRPRALRAVQALLADNREAALRAFNATLEHRFPGTLEAETETTDD